jgi:sugar phosphate isomerase/epimerase
MSTSETTPPIEHLALQMYTMRNLQMPLAELLEKIAAAGYTGIESFGPLEPPAAELRPLLDAAGLQVVSAHVAIDALTDDLDSVIAYHRALGNHTLIVPWLHPDRRGADAAGWRAVGASLADLATRCNGEGMRLLYHNHDFEVATFDGRTALEWLLVGADDAAPGLVGAELDLAWVLRAGADPVALLQALAGRCPRAHAKDVAPAGANEAEEGHADVGDGLIDWGAVLPALRLAGVEWLVVEHDAPADPLRTMQRSAAYLAGRW